MDGIRPHRVWAGMPTSSRFELWVANVSVVLRRDLNALVNGFIELRAWTVLWVWYTSPEQLAVGQPLSVLLKVKDFRAKSCDGKLTNDWIMGESPKLIKEFSALLLRGVNTGRMPREDFMEFEVKAEVGLTRKRLEIPQR